MEKTILQYDEVIEKSRSWFAKNYILFWAFWKMHEAPALTEALFKSARDISTSEKQGNLSDYDVQYMNLLNFTIAAAIKVSAQIPNSDTISRDIVIDLYDKEIAIAKELMQNKNHDYGEAWRDMRLSTFTDFILMKILRIMQIQNNDGKTLISEPAEAGYRDMINYCIFALIKIDEAKSS